MVAIAIISAIVGTILAIIGNYPVIKTNLKLRKYKAALEQDEQLITGDIQIIEKRQTDLQNKLDNVIKELEDVYRSQSQNKLHYEKKEAVKVYDAVLDITLSPEHYRPRTSWEAKPWNPVGYHSRSIDRNYMNEIILGYVESSMSQLKSIPGQDYFKHAPDARQKGKLNTQVY